ncbi:hypothetical protein [Ferroplasma sp.]|uniref:hypothetical protein n=1 Tax=Ferroplasma sp. TaxID=2591003 RepID=UPI00260A9B10|nr:hypothetical protein [Ferroplasma sp.]
MNKKILVIGIAMLIIGIAMAAGGTEYFEDSFKSSSSTHYTEIRATGLNVSGNITVKSGYIVMVDGAVSNSGLVNYSSLASVKNITTLNSVEQKASESDAGLELFIDLKPGTYKYVYFNSTSTLPEYGHITGSQFDAMAALILGGGFIGIVGFIVMIYGAIKKQKPKNPYAADDPYNIDNIKI